MRSWPYAVTATAGFAALAWRLPTRTPAEIALLVAWLVMTAAGVVLAGIDAAVHRLPRPILTGSPCSSWATRWRLVSGDSLDLLPTACGDSACINRRRRCCPSRDETGVSEPAGGRESWVQIMTMTGLRWLVA